MKSIGIGAAALLAALLLGKPASAEEKQKPVAFRAYKHPVTIWVPPYAVAKSNEQLTASFDGVGVKDAITHLDLQFWVPTATGSVARVGFGEVSDESVIKLRDWAHAQGIRVLLCVYNGAEKWDWELARAAFADHRADFVKSLIAEMEHLGLDGIDIDLEGPGSFDADKPAFVAFMTDLSHELHSRSRHLTVDTFQSDKWNAPNQSWWPELFPLVDALTTMGYDDSGSTAPEWRAYAAQKKAAGKYAAKLQLGVPSDKAEWRGNTALEQLQWIQTDGSMGIGIWDAQLPAPAWRSAPLWRMIQAIRGNKK